MSVTVQPQDSWFSNINVTGLGVFPAGMYYYFMSNDDMINENGIIGNCNAIHSVWTSFLFEKADFDLNQIPYDVTRFGEEVGAYIPSTPDVYRITNILNTEKHLATLVKYKRKTPTTPNIRDWRNESRLYNYPYMYGMLTDHANTPLEVHYHEILNYVNDIEIYSKQMISDKGTHSLYVENLKNDLLGQYESMVSTAPTEIAVGSSAYSQWSSSQKAQDNFNIRSQIMQMGLANNTTQRMSELNQQQAILNGTAGVITGVAGGIGAGIQGNLGGAISGFGSAFMSGANAGFDYQRNQITREQSNKQLDQTRALAIGGRDAKLKDLSNTPRSMLSTGSDIAFTMMNGQLSIDFVRYRCTTEYLERLGDYFAMYGYRQAKTMIPNTRNRHYYNYIKTVGANIAPKVNTGIPKEHLAKLQNIFDNGTTIWHIDRPNVTFMSYYYDNVEVS